MNTNVLIEDYFNSVISTLRKIERSSITEFVNMISKTYDEDGTIFVFGNGGSGATASHICGDFLKGVSCELDKRLKVICLNDNIPALMAIANDMSYEDIFVEQLKIFLKQDDLVIGISGSGNSQNVIKAIEYANQLNVNTVALCGFSGGTIRKIASLSIHADINNMEVAEDIHLIVAHCVKSILIRKLNVDSTFSSSISPLADIEVIEGPLKKSHTDILQSPFNPPNRL